MLIKIMTKWSGISAGIVVVGTVEFVGTTCVATVKPKRMKI